MIRILLDINAYAAFKRGNADAVEILRHADQIGISVIMMGELLAGFAAGSASAPEALGFTTPDNQQIAASLYQALTYPTIFLLL